MKTGSFVVHSALFGLAICVVPGCGGGQAPSEPPAQSTATDFSEEVRNVLDRKMQLVEALAAEPLVIDAVREANRQNQNLSEAEIRNLDFQWQRSEGLDDFIKPFLTNDCAQRLIEFQEAEDAFPEIFVTDRRGLIVAETNKTSDFLQADEDWWSEAFDGGRGKAFYGPIEYDESSKSEAISLYVPVIDPAPDEAVGVIKAVCDITAIKMEL